MRPLILFVVGAAAIAGARAHAVAEPSAAERAREVAIRGTQAAEAGDLAGAIARFKEARALDDRAEYLCNIGYAYQLAGELPRAHLFLSECLVRAAAMDPGVATAFRARLADVEGALRAGGFAPVDVTVSPRGAAVGSSAFAADETAPGPRLVWLPPGRHHITASAPGHAPGAIELDVTGSGRHAASIELAPQRREATPPHVAPRPDPEPRDPAVTAAPGRDRTPAIAVLAGGGVAVAAGGVFHVLALRTRDDIAAHHPFEGPERDAREATWRTQVTGMAIGYGVGAVAIGVGAYLWWRTGRAPAPLRASGGDGVAAFGWRF